MHYQQRQHQVHRAIELDTPLYADCDVAREFSRFPSEFYALDPVEQELCRWYVRLRREKEGYAARDQIGRQYWPKDPPLRQPHQ